MRLCLNIWVMFVLTHHIDQPLIGEAAENKWNNLPTGVLFHENNKIYHKQKYARNISKPFTPNLQTETQFGH